MGSGPLSLCWPALKRAGSSALAAGPADHIPSLDLSLSTKERLKPRSTSSIVLLAAGVFKESVAKAKEMLAGERRMFSCGAGRANILQRLNAESMMETRTRTQGSLPREWAVDIHKVQC